MIIDHDSIGQMADRYRANFINSVLGAKPALLVGSQNTDGKTNLAIMSSAFHLGANPSLLGLIIRPSESPRHTLDNILATGYYTFNHVNPQHIDAAHQTSARYTEQQCEFEQVCLSQEYINNFPAPFVKQSTIGIGLKLVEHHLLNVNKTHLLIGEVLLVDLPSNLLGQDGYVDVAANKSIAVTGLDNYTRLQSIKRLSYAKVNQWPTEIS